MTHRHTSAQADGNTPVLCTGSRDLLGYCQTQWDKTRASAWNTDDGATFVADTEVVTAESAVRFPLACFISPVSASRFCSLSHTLFHSFLGKHPVADASCAAISGYKTSLTPILKSRPLAQALQAPTQKRLSPTEVYILCNI